MGRVEEYREELRRIENVKEFLTKESRLPGPRANLELAFAFALEGKAEQFLEFSSLDSIKAPKNTELEFLAFCGTLGLGYLLSESSEPFISILQKRASDSRWRVRGAVILGLQRWGRENPEKLLSQMFVWAEGNNFEKRAAIGALSEPRVLKEIKQVGRVFDLLDLITLHITCLTAQDEGFLALRKTLGYCWSVVVSVSPCEGKPRMEKWIRNNDSTVRWIMKENLKKKRLERLDVEWVLAQKETLKN